MARPASRPCARWRWGSRGEAWPAALATRRPAYEAQDWAKAWTAISTVCRLDPERETPLAMRAELVAHLRTPAALIFADALLARLPDLGPQVALFLSFTLAALGNGDRTRLATSWPVWKSPAMSRSR